MATRRGLDTSVLKKWTWTRTYVFAELCLEWLIISIGELNQSILNFQKDGRQIITVRRGCRNNEWIDSCEPSGWFSNRPITLPLLRTNQKARILI